MTTNPEVLRIAREIAANIAAPNECVLRDKYLSGVCDPSYKVQIAIAAIEKTTELAASWMKSTDPATHVLNSMSVKRLFDEYRTEAEARGRSEGRRAALKEVKKEVDRLFNWHGTFPYPSPHPDAVRSGLHSVGLYLKRLMGGE